MMREPGGPQDGVRTLAVIQANYTDVLPGDSDASHYCVAALRRSRLVDRIVIAAADVPRNRGLRNLAEEWGVDVFLGSELDIVDRTLQAAAFVGAARDAVIVRVLMNRFYLDIDLVDRMIERLRESHSDFAMLPFDFDINFGADVVTLDCLRRVDRTLAGTEWAHERFRPWLFIEDHPDRFQAVTCDDVPVYQRGLLQEIRSSGWFPTRDHSTYSGFTYELIAKTLKPSDIALDMACGSGEGTAILARACAHVYGADFSAEAINEARALHQLPNATYDVQVGCSFRFSDGFFSAIVSAGTLERVEDDEAMLRSFHRVLRAGGRLILEAQILRTRPFGLPLNASVIREYDKESLLAMLTRCGFVPVRKYGMNRGMYISWDRAREGVLIHARRAA